MTNNNGHVTAIMHVNLTMPLGMQASIFGAYPKSG